QIRISLGTDGRDQFRHRDFTASQIFPNHFAPFDQDSRLTQNPGIGAAVEGQFGEGDVQARHHQNAEQRAIQFGLQDRVGRQSGDHYNRHQIVGGHLGHGGLTHQPEGGDGGGKKKGHFQYVQQITTYS